jgi:membrane protease YdiL (CAAX protease family)
MSILADVAPAPTPVTTAPVPEESLAANLAVAGCLLAFAVVGMVLLRVFRRGRIVGPVRLGPAIGVGRVVGVTLLSGMIWITAQGFFAAQAGENLGPRDLALISTVPSVLALIAMLIGDRSLHARFLKRLGVTAWNFLRAWKIAILAALVILPTVYASGILLELFYRAIRYEHPTEHEMLGAMAQASVIWRAMLVVGACVIAPVYEEMLFRGHIQTIAARMLHRWGFGADGSGAARWIAVATASVVFAAVHPLWMAPMILVLSVGLGYVYERTANLWASILVHAIFNTISTVVFLNLR